MLKVISYLKELDREHIKVFSNSFKQNRGKYK